MSDSKYSGLIFTAVLVATLFISAAKATGADFGQANVFNEFYFTFSGDNEGNAVISATPRSNDSRLRSNSRTSASSLIWKIGLQLLDGGGAAKADAAPWLAAAYLSLAHMGLPEATLLAEQMRQRGLTPPGL